MEVFRRLIESHRFESFITTLIVINAITLGLETIPSVAEQYGILLHVIDRLLLAIFVAELLGRVLVYRTGFFRDPWRIFDLVIIGVSLVPSSGSLSVLRALRVLRVLRLISFVPSMRRVVGGLFAALPGMGSIFLLLCLVFYVFSVMSTKLYGDAFPVLFGDIARSAFTLFQVMTLEGWAMEVVRPVMELHPHAWMFFLPFILATSFTVLNLFIGIIVAAMESEHEVKEKTDKAAAASDQQEMLAEIRALRQEVASLRAATIERTSATDRAGA